MASRPALPIALCLALAASPLFAQAQGPAPSAPHTYVLHVKDFFGVVGAVGVIYGSLSVQAGVLGLLGEGAAVGLAAVGIGTGGVAIGAGLLLVAAGAFLMDWARSVPDEGSNADRTADTSGPLSPSGVSPPGAPAVGVTR